MLKSFLISLISTSILALVPSVANAQEGKPKSQELTQKQMMELDRKAAMKAPSGSSFYISAIAEIPGRYSLVLTDQNSKFVSETFSDSQIIIFEAILEEAKKFAQTEEAVGKTRPVITRFFDKNEPAFIVDVAKMLDQSHFYITIRSLTGHLTVDAGSIKRGAKEPSSPLFYTVLARVQGRNSSSNQQ